VSLLETTFETRLLPTDNSRVSGMQFPPGHLLVQVNSRNKRHLDLAEMNPTQDVQ
jgi:hypothetical protein